MNEGRCGALLPDHPVYRFQRMDGFDRSSNNVPISVLYPDIGWILRTSKNNLCTFLCHKT